MQLKQVKMVHKNMTQSTSTNSVSLRDVIASDLPIFFEHQQDPVAIYMAAFTAKDPTNREAFNNHWHKIMTNDTITIKTILSEGNVAGHIVSFEQLGQLEVSYWIGRTYWGQGVATEALLLFLSHIKTRPLHARVAKDNLGSIRVLEKCGFTIVGEDKGFANARGQEIEEFLLRLSGEQKLF